MHAPGARQDTEENFKSWTDVYGHPVRFQFMSVHSTLPHEFRGRSDRECQDLRLGRLGVPRPARIAARLTLCPRDLPGLRIRLTTVPCILPERLELTWCHRGICRRVVEVHRSTTGPLIASALQSQVKSFGIGQNTGETLPNFRQKSKGILKGS
ncbi:F-box family protein with DUF295 [Prunus dulcis]|uniref:F-box family protein with DUF295 n=1 Tax=Prunus dulcis TaxID=3755 RepID=A0A4Y1R189_PRUDU|nr:F-box family protein with DUF295 [Prunus dulcis]